MSQAAEYKTEAVNCNQELFTSHIIHHLYEHKQLKMMIFLGLYHNAMVCLNTKKQGLITVWWKNWKNTQMLL